MNCAATSGQFAAVISAPRLRAAFSPGACGIGQHQFTFAVSCFTSAPLPSARSAGQICVGWSPPARRLPRSCWSPASRWSSWRFGLDRRRPPPARVQAHVQARFLGDDAGALRRRVRGCRQRRGRHRPGPGRVRAARRCSICSAAARGAGTRRRRHHLRHPRRRAGLGRPAVRHPPGSHRRPGRLLRHAVATRAAAGLRPADPGVGFAAVGAVAAENILSPTPVAASVARSRLHPGEPDRAGLAADALRGRRRRAPDGTFLLRSPAGDAVAEASIARGDIAAPARPGGRWSGREVLAAGAIVLLLLIGPLLDRRAASREPRTFVTQHARWRRCCWSPGPARSGSPSTSSAAAAGDAG